MELFFLAVLILLMASALASGYPVAFALPGSAIITIALAAGAGVVFSGNPDAYFAHGGPGQWLSAGVTNLRGVYWEVERDTLIAIPLFVFMGIMLQRSKIAEDLLVAMAQLFGPIPGGLGISVIFVGALLAATTGILGATVVAMGLISLPAMMRNNYSNALSTGTIAASGTLGQIIPPSIVLIILADQLASAVDQASTARKALYKATTGELSMPSAFDVSSTSAGEMFLGAFLPGLVLVGLYMLFVLVFAIARPKMAPAVPFEGKFNLRFIVRIGVILIPPLTLIFVVLGSIIAGIATVNQAGAIGAVGATIMASYRLYSGRKGAYTPAILAILSLSVIIWIASNHPVNVQNIKTAEDRLWLQLITGAVVVFLFAFAWSLLRTLRTNNALHGVMIETAKTTSLVFIILLGAAMLTAAFRAFGGEELVRDFLTSLPGGFWTQFFIVMAVIFLLGFFLDFIEIAVVVVPIVTPILLMDPAANVTAVWLGVMIGLNIQTSFLTPPFGFALFYLRGVASSAVRTVQMYKGVVPFICLQLIALFIVANTPWLVNYLPNRVSLLSETAPPPVNPRLQYCMESYILDTFATDGGPIRAAIADARALDLSVLPADVAKDLQKSFEAAESSFRHVDEIAAATAAVQAAAPGYRPVRVRVRELQAGMRRIEEQRTERADRLDLLKRVTPRDDTAVSSAEQRIRALEEEHAGLEARIPSTWNDEHDAFATLQKAENSARASYRRSADAAYGPVAEVTAIIRQVPRLAALEPALRAVSQRVAGQAPEQAMETLSELRSRFTELDGTRDIARELSRARRALRGSDPDREKAQQHVAGAMEALDTDLAWRRRAEADLLAGLGAYSAAIQDTLGLRSQPRLPPEQAIYVARCQSTHRDLSLNF